MALNIANRVVEDKAILVAKLLGQNKTAAVERALDDFLLRHGAKERREEMQRDAATLLDGFSRLPVLDARSADEIIGYHENGLL
uniref:Antitoxin VapB n=1 Tax=Candidatus Kentrum sp. FM TaxID=2126340 RepID=A0A450SYB7_9GAMM|nr:MAG: antitoxin VapB [Candidatus Kentron sp. FM]VFJ62464.1 MAG: antitoxin VapB [Candidatus Kentron sp. FM]VFK12371.1 MAG: antitoxin VapB [Candidatus Kentron sp. FM]